MVVRRALVVAGSTFEHGQHFVGHPDTATTTTGAAHVLYYLQ
jgi:hypothetical protein